ncbi:class I SAM-dependent methyltransferase [Candidatus Shapirobacteria bacterium]|nr:class I SAM-dependent methyltransferase [Candidatus Shapirobacteria bacterium]
MSLVREDILAVLAKDFSHKRALGRRALCKVLIELSLKVETSETILDLGCGSGRLLIPLAKLYPHKKFVGVDLSEEMLISLRDNVVGEGLTNVEVIKADFDNGWTEKLSSIKFDLVIFFQSIHFVGDLPRLVNRVKTILSDKGSMIIASTNHEQFYGLPYCRSLEKVLKRELSRTPDEPVIVRAFTDGGFSLINRVILTVKKQFTPSTLEMWTQSRPFSVLAYLTNVEFKKWQKNFHERVSGREVVIDRMVILTFGLVG